MTFDELTKDDLMEVESFSGIPVIEVLTQFRDFIQQNAPRIRGFYEGRSNTISVKDFKKLSWVMISVKDAIEKIQNGREDFLMYKHWVLLELFEDALHSLEILENYALWSRSNRERNIYSKNIEIEYVQQQGEFLEQIEEKHGSVNSDMAWYDLAIRNTLREEDYDSDGGKPLKVLFRNLPSGFIRTVIDHIDNGFKSFGLDLDKSFKIVEDDLKVLSHKETLYQSGEILLNLRKGDNPRFPTMGVDQASLLGVNRGAIMFPVIFRQLIQLFSTDDSFASITIGKVEVKQDAIFINVEMFSRFRESEEGLVVL